MSPTTESTQEVVVTNDFVDYVNRHVVDKTIQRDLSTYKDNTDGNGNGHKIKANGDGHIDNYQSHEGDVKKLIIDGSYNLWFFDLRISYRYSSSTHGERWECLFDNCSKSDNVWGSVHPKGTMIASFTAVPNRNLQVRLEIHVDPDHNDQPGHFVRDFVIPMFRNDVLKAAEEFTGLVIDSLEVAFV